MLKMHRSQDQGRIWLALEGSAESEGVSELESALRVLREDALTKGAQSVALDLRELEFATSSCLKVLATWLIEANESQSFKVTFITSSKHAWQRRSLRAITACAPEVASIEAESA